MDHVASAALSAPLGGSVAVSSQAGAVYCLSQEMNTLLAHRALACRSTTLSLHPLAPARAAFSTSLAVRASAAAQDVQRTEQAATPPPRKQGTIQLAKNKRRAAAPADPTLEESIEMLDRIHEMEHVVRFDVWASPVRLFGEPLPQLAL